ncbi:TIGR00730 family Rossman fold protein [Roseibacterium beibuensis]|uniref:Cytokinin riboside 5'-monophosphate phosphoribohydrolase n=1 Tax=[Roseibacterium] beibuensis TaxID=1193142 RepID=A0ABP9L654_9RHOB|nr:TIGR00730 family Rossman fold protein [Roseibacterium beibuensis]MCS6621335.1 TIGR00730 family Rossman fold protein [Roseibacterium beibuensis]
MSSFSVCVYCGSRVGRNPAYLEAATELGAALAESGYRLVYGAGDVGLMGAVARAAQQAGGETFGVIPTHLLDLEVGKRDLTSFIVTETMHERKKVMFMNSDAIVMLPGGAGSLDEFFEVLTWRQLGLHDKSLILLGTEGYWQPLLDLVAHVVREGFADASLLEFYKTVPDIPSLMSELSGALS